MAGSGVDFSRCASGLTRNRRPLPGGCISGIPNAFSGRCARPAKAFPAERAIVCLQSEIRRVREFTQVALRPLTSWGTKMKKMVVALAALAAFTGSASPADLAAPPAAKAPRQAPAGG